jgi:hypothetical protein
MSEPMRLIVDAFVRLKDREKLAEMREHRQRLRSQLLQSSGQHYDVTETMRILDDDLREIDAGVERLQ